MNLYAQLKATARHGNTENILLNCVCVCRCNFTHRSTFHKLIYFNEFYKPFIDDVIAICFAVSTS